MLTLKVFPLTALGVLCLATSTGLAQHEPTKKPAAAKPIEAVKEVIPYTAKTCPISGEELGSMGEPIVREYDGREVRFCCKKCIAKFEADKEAGFKKLDDLLIEDQKPYYPLTTCIISGESLTEDGEDSAVDLIYHNRLVRFCCRDCLKDFREDPEAAMAKLDAAVAEQQRAHYPLEKCPVSGEKLGEMGDPHEVVVAGRLVRLCCSKCEKKLLANPVKYLGAIDAAWKAQGVPAALEHAPGERDHGAAEHPDHAEHHEHGG
ncbi:MAG: hypothetical protein IPJ41_02235 [Phycisphaerales bacterium]|nr:hypothetical protein [Phycisphaerales bacterium]